LPELPEVETIVRELAPRLEGRTIRRVRLSHDDVLRGVTRPTLLRGLAGARIEAVGRRAKHAVVRTNRRRLVLQPGMTGAMFVKRRLAAGDRRYGVLRAELDDGRSFVYRDVRRLGTLLWLDEPGWLAYTRALGPEPLERGFTAARLGSILRRSRSAVKKVLMDQRQLAGVGNIYANEALFAAGIDPSREARRLTPAEHRRLHRALTRILRSAIAANGTTFRDYRTGRGEPGNFQLELMVYERAGDACKRCGATLTGTHAIDARITVFCHRCQR
jgi:formamidopyrimidine-DNA glycosylase